jgi:hypothetical protein
MTPSSAIVTIAAGGIRALDWTRRAACSPGFGEHVVEPRMRRGIADPLWGSRRFAGIRMPGRLGVFPAASGRFATSLGNQAMVPRKHFRRRSGSLRDSASDPWPPVASRHRLGTKRWYPEGALGDGVVRGLGSITSILARMRRPPPDPGTRGCSQPRPRSGWRHRSVRRTLFELLRRIVSRFRRTSRGLRSLCDIVWKPNDGTPETLMAQVRFAARCGA